MGKNPLFRLFGASPIKPLQQHMGKVTECVGLLVPFFDAVRREDFEAADRIQEQIVELENAADALKHELRLHLPRGFMLPVERRDLLEVLTMQDQVANKAKDIAGLVRGRHMQLPPSIVSLFTEFVARGVQACEQANSTIGELDELVETGFTGREVTRVQEMITELDRLEHESDELQIRVRAALFAIEAELPPVEVMFLYRIIEWVGDVGDRAQRVGSRMQLMLVG